MGYSFKTQEVGEIDRKGSRSVERLFNFMNGNDRRCFPDGRKRMKKPAKIENVCEKIHARAKKML